MVQVVVELLVEVAVRFQRCTKLEQHQVKIVGCMQMACSAHTDPMFCCPCRKRSADLVETVPDPGSPHLVGRKRV